MITELVNQLATEAGIKLASVELEDGRPLDCIDLNLLSMKSRGIVVNTAIYNNELEVESVSNFSEHTKEKIRKTLGRLRVLLDA